MISDYKSVIVVFSDGSGGNHVINMLSLSEYTEDRHDDFRSVLLHRYNDNNNDSLIHTGEMIGPYRPTIEVAELAKQAKKTYITGGHFHEVYENIELFKSIGKLAVVVLEWDNESSVEHRKSSGNRKFYNPSDHKFVFNKETLCKLFAMHPDDIYPICVTTLISKDASSIWNYLNDSFELNLDIEFCNRLHTIWFNRFFR